MPGKIFLGGSRSTYGGLTEKGAGGSSKRLLRNADGLSIRTQGVYEIPCRLKVLIFERNARTHQFLFLILGKSF
ncbi:MAG: hypothetical protein DVB28_001651 [Verrucomicrobia bacterium]|nr:MAG: hypothetical protein DVB28_001651 [Verrucomicrobiota bacterium]